VSLHGQICLCEGHLVPLPVRLSMILLFDNALSCFTFCVPGNDITCNWLSDAGNMLKGLVLGQNAQSVVCFTVLIRKLKVT
jgi:hypothetical protein